MQIYNPKFGWVTIPESSLQGLDQIVIQLLATKASDPGSILKHIQDVINKYSEQEWHRNNGPAQPVQSQTLGQPAAV